MAIDIFYYFVSHFVSSFEKLDFWSYFSSFYILNVDTLSDKPPANIFSLPICFFFTVLTDGCAEPSQYNLCYKFASVASVLGSQPKRWKNFVYTNVSKYFPMFPFHIFIVLGLAFRPVIFHELISVNGENLVLFFCLFFCFMCVDVYTQLCIHISAVHLPPLLLKGMSLCQSTFLGSLFC